MRRWLRASRSPGTSERARRERSAIRSTLEVDMVAVVVGGGGGGCHGAIFGLFVAGCHGEGVDGSGVGGWRCPGRGWESGRVFVLGLKSDLFAVLVVLPKFLSFQKKFEGVTYILKFLKLRFDI